MDDATQSFIMSKIMDNIHKYFYHIVFAGYIHDAAVATREAVDDEKKSGLALPMENVQSPPLNLL